MEGADCNGVVPWTPSGARVVTVTVFVLFVDVVVEVEAQIGVDTAEEVLATEMVPTCGSTRAADVEVETGFEGILVVVTLVLASAGLNIDDETVATVGVVVEACVVVELAAGSLFGLVFDEVAFTEVIVEVGEDVEVGFGEDVVGLVVRAETFWVSAEVEDTTGEIHDKAEACKSFAAVDIAVVAADVTFTVFDKVLLAVVTDVAGTDVETTLMARGDDEQVDGLVATGVEVAVVLAESGSIVFMLLEDEGFGSTGAWGGVKTSGVGLTLGGVN